MKIGNFECKLQRNGVITVKYHPGYTIVDGATITKFYTKVARRNKHCLPKQIAITGM